MDIASRRHHHLRVDANLNGRDWVVGDIHGHFGRLKSALRAVNFDPRSDRLFATGDMIDRGPQSEQVLNWLKMPWFNSIQGNHEAMAIQWARGHLDTRSLIKNGGAWLTGQTQPEIDRIISTFTQLPITIEIPTPRGMIGLVHAECPLDNWCELVDQINANASAIIESAQWSRERIKTNADRHVSGIHEIFCGHTCVERALNLGNHRFIDTGAWIEDPKKARITLVNITADETVSLCL